MSESVETIIKEQLPDVLIPMELNAEPAAAYDEYIALATKLGVVNQKVANIIMLRALQKLEIPVYNWTKVYGFLDSLQAAANAGLHFREHGIWCWKAVKEYHDNGLHTHDSGLYTVGYSAFQGALVKGPYLDEIPLHALKRMDAVLGELPDAQCFVSALGMPKPDPFLAVRANGSNLFVIDHWDEPGFKLVEKD